MRKTYRRRGHKLDLFLDCGAFSAATMGVNIDVDEYAEYVKENGPWKVIASLDDIQDPKRTLKLYDHMTQHHEIDAIPTFHYGEPFKYLYNYLSDARYIGIGGMVPISTSKLIPWLDKVWRAKRHWEQVRGRQIKFHGFGVGKLGVLKRYPWETVDSTSWVAGAMFGAAAIFDKAECKFKKWTPPVRVHRAETQTNDNVWAMMKSVEWGVTTELIGGTPRKFAWAMAYLGKKSWMEVQSYMRKLHKNDMIIYLASANVPGFDGQRYCIIELADIEPNEVNTCKGLLFVRPQST
jgi:hypothetical protein